MLEHLKSIWVGFYSLTITGVVLAGIGAPLAWLMVCHPSWFWAVVALGICWFTGMVMRSEGGLR